MSNKKYLIYRGDVRAIESDGHTLFFTTVHPEGQATGLYSVDLETYTPTKASMPGGVAMTRDDTALFVAGIDRHVWRAPIDDISQLAPMTADPVTSDISALTCVSRQQLAIAHGYDVSIVARAGGKPHQTLTIPERVTALAADASGEWLVVGTERGLVMVWEREDKDAFILSAQAKLHEGEVRALLFETEELRVLSTGSDTKLLVTHVRGDLDPEDRGGSGMHDKAITAMMHGLEGRFYTTGLDSTIKAWPAGRTHQRPATQGDGVVRTNDFCIVTYEDAPHIASAGQDNSLRLFPINEEGKVDERVLSFFDALAWARNELAKKDPERRERALRKLASFNDAQSLEMIHEFANREQDHKLRVLATRLLGESENPQAIARLQDLIYDQSSEVRLLSLKGLRTLQGHTSLEPLQLALRAHKRDVGEAAIDALSALAGDGDDKALDIITDALDQNPPAVRLAALNALETYYGRDTPEAHLIALRSRHSDIRTAALVRCHTLDLLGDMRVEAALRRASEDSDENIRRDAHLISVLRRPHLARALRAQDEVINRQIFDIETFTDTREEGEPEPEPPKVSPVDPATLADDDWAPLLEAMASRSLDTCMRGARGLALLQDTRSFGTLLQLSRESDDSARVLACQSFEALGDPRSIKRLKMMLRDRTQAVRDAAFSALLELEADVPLDVARSGLSAEHQDVRKRGLQVLIDVLKQDELAEATNARAEDLLARTLNDSYQEVRSEALKAALNLQVGGDAEAALRFGNESIHADVRLDVLVEVMAQYEEDWAWNMLLEFLEDPDTNLRQDAFEYALKKARRERRRQSLSAALLSRYEDTRLASVRELTQRKLDDFEELLLRALDDPSAQVRRTAVDAMIRADARQLLIAALDSKHDDIRVRAAASLAGLGEDRALETLLELALAAEPNAKNDPDDHRQWRQQVPRALQGIAELGDPSAREAVRPLIESDYADIRKEAVRALVWTSRREALGTLREVVRHSDEAVKREAALGLSYFGDDMTSWVLSDDHVPADERLYASLGLIEEDEDAFLSFLDDYDTTLRRRAFLILMLLELTEHDDVPDKCLAALSSEHPQLRLLAARGIEAFTEREAFEQFVRDLFNTLLARSEEGHDIAMEVIEDISRALTHGSVQVKIRAARLLSALHNEHTDEFERQWAIYERRYRAELDALREQAAAQTSTSAEDDGAEEGRIKRAWRAIKRAATSAIKGEKEALTFEQALLQLVFGAYVGLSREQRDLTTQKRALRHLAQMRRHGDLFLHEVDRALIIGLGDANQEVRQLAIDLLLDGGIDANELANEALSTTFSDMGSRGLQLLAERGGAEDGRALLTETMLTKTDGLEVEAAKLLAEDLEWIPTYTLGLGAASKSWRTTSLRQLVEQWDTDEDARAGVLKALQSRFDDMRYGAADAIAYRDDLSEETHERVYAILHELLTSSDGDAQRRGIRGLEQLGDARAAHAMLDRLAEDPDGSARTTDLMRSAASFRDTSTFETFVEYIDRDVERWTAFQAALTVTGHDQQILDPDDEREDDAWIEDQAPRHDELLARLLDLAYRLADISMLRALLPPARWSRTNKADAALAPLAMFSQESVQFDAIEAIGWRLRNRDGSPDMLLRVLDNGAPEAQFLAAEALALDGRKEGLAVLMTAVNFMESYDDRRRAILALGQLGDPQALDLLLEIVRDEEHYLRPAAAEAIGHMADTPRADEIFNLLTGLTDAHYDLAKGALVGLRYFNTREAWRAIRAAARDNSWWKRQCAAELLGHNDDDANIDTLAALVREDSDSDVAQAAAESLRTIYGKDSVEPDYILVQARFSWLSAQQNTVKRLREDGDAARILEVLPKIREENADTFLSPLVNALLAREPLPIDEVAPLLSSEEVRTASVAAQIIGRAGKEASAHADTLISATEAVHEQWTAARRDALARRRGAPQRLRDATRRYRLLLWTCGRLEVGAAQMTKAMELSEGAHAKPVRRQALIGLGEEWIGDEAIPTLIEAIHGNDAELRELASTALKAIAPERAAALLDDVMEDAATFDRLLPQGDAYAETIQTTLRAGADSIHLQGVVLGHMSQRGDVAGLEAALNNQNLSDEIRLGAIDGLAQIATPETDPLLEAIGKSEDEDEELRKAAWRALRRSRRLRARRTQDDSTQGVSA